MKKLAFDKLSIETIRKRPWLEALAVVSVGLAAWLWLWGRGGGPLHWDDLWYMELALNPSAQPKILSRYFHIYLLYFFNLFNPDPFVGVRLYWSVVVTLTAGLVYLNARLLARAFLPAAAAILIFTAQSFIFKFAGVAFSDYTLMLLYAITVLIYLLLPRQKDSRPLLIALGIIFFFGFQSKETVLPLGLLLPGLGWLEGEGFRGQALLRGVVWVVFGIAVGFLAMMLLHQIILGDALFGLRPESIAAWLGMNTTSYLDPERTVRIDLIGYFMSQLTLNPALLVPVLLTLITGFYTTKNWNYERWLWIAWLGVFVFLFATRWLPIPRYLIPAFPLMAILAAQILRIDQPLDRHARLTVLLLAVAALAALIGAALFGTDLLDHVSQKGLDGFGFHAMVLVPILLAFFMAALYLLRRFNPATILIPLSLLLMMLAPPVYDNWKILNRRYTAVQSERRFYPFAAFAGQVRYSPEMRVFVSEGMLDADRPPYEHGLLGRDPSSNSWMFDLYFRHESSPEQFDMGATAEYGLRYNQYTYAFLTVAEWQSLPGALRRQIGDTYLSANDPEDIFVFLRQK